MATNYIQRGRVIDVLAPAAGFISGTPVAVGTMIGVPQNDGVENDVVPCGIKGVYILPLKTGGADLAIGTPVGLDVATGEVTGVTSAVAGDLNTAGKVAANGVLGADTEVEVLLTPDAGVIV